MGLDLDATTALPVQRQVVEAIFLDDLVIGDDGAICAPWQQKTRRGKGRHDVLVDVPVVRRLQGRHAVQVTEWRGQGNMCFGMTPTGAPSCLPRPSHTCSASIGRR